jgi:pimeloyl-ACP methyl ester carboxylesterase
MTVTRGEAPSDPLVVRFAVGEAFPSEVTRGEAAWITARVFAPTRAPRGRPSVLVCLHGGSYDWRYFHIQGPGLEGYSMAEHLAARGHIVIVPDQLGVGESARPTEPLKATRAVAAAANHHAMRQAFARLAEGSLHPRIAACPDALKVGVGHSLGGMVLVTEQARFATYDLVAPIGYGCGAGRLEVDGESITMADADRALVIETATPGYERVNRALISSTFHWEDVSPQALAADEAMSTAFLSIMAWEARHAHTAQEAAAIQTPVFLAFGERDVSPDPWAEPAFYRSSPDITLYRLPRTAHCHNFAPLRRRLWDRLDAWIAAASAGGG